MLPYYYGDPAEVIKLARDAQGAMLETCGSAGKSVKTEEGVPSR
jgi:hypothetical protein